MDPKHIISFEFGTMYLKLREEFNTCPLQINCAIACIDRNGLEVVKGDSMLEVSSKRMVLSKQELALISEGYEMVKHFWKDQLLPHRHVLLSCGCVHSWDELVDPNNAHALIHSLWCPNHEETGVYRCNLADFPEIAEQAQQEATT